VTGCNNPPRVGDVIIPPYEVLAQLHNDRVGRLEGLAARGNIELRWTDEDGRHFAPGDVDVWIVPPRQTALYISKVGERIMWLGSDDEHSWVFDFRDQDQTSLLVTDLDDVVGSGSLPIEPAALLTLAGLTPVPLISDGTVGFDIELDAYVIEARSAGMPIRLYLDKRQSLPVRVTISSESGEPLMTSTMELSRYERMSITDASPLAGPKVPTLIDVTSPTGDLDVKLSLPQPSDADLKADYFDLDWLTERFRPDVIEGLSPVTAGGP
jgi:hypothetical protein